MFPWPFSTSPAVEEVGWLVGWLVGWISVAPDCQTPVTSIPCPTPGRFVFFCVNVLWGGMMMMMRGATPEWREVGVSGLAHPQLETPSLNWCFVFSAV
jgi:hypothetical protein